MAAIEKGMRVIEGDGGLSGERESEHSRGWYRVKAGGVD